MAPQMPTRVSNAVPMPPQAQAMVDYEAYLLAIGDKLSCYFTIERCADTDATESAFNDAQIVPEDVETLDALVAKLSRELTGISASRDPDVPAVIHLVENRLKVEGYVMESKVTINYNGTPFGLLIQLRNQHVGVGPKLSGPLPFMILDDITPVSVNVQDVTVRQILTGAVPLSGYCRIIWDACTDTEQNAQVDTEVAFNGPASPDPDEN